MIPSSKEANGTASFIRRINKAIVSNGQAHGHSEAKKAVMIGQSAIETLLVNRLLGLAKVTPLTESIFTSSGFSRRPSLTLLFWAWHCKSHSSPGFAPPGSSERKRVRATQLPNQIEEFAGSLPKDETLGDSKSPNHRDLTREFARHAKVPLEPIELPSDSTSHDMSEPFRR